MVELHVERTIPASPEGVFTWLADPVNLTAGPLILEAAYTEGSTPGAGAVREAIAVGMWLREEITSYDARTATPTRSCAPCPPSIMRAAPCYALRRGTARTLTG